MEQKIWDEFDEKFENAMKKWMKDPTKGFANYLLAEYEKEPIYLSED